MTKEEIIQLAKSLDADLIETHISYIVLAKKFAFKIKKPVRTSFLDYSTISKRRKMCYEELAINKTLSKGVYLSVESIKDSRNGIKIGNGNGQTIDYCLKMKRLDSNKQLSVMIKRNVVKKSSVQKLAGLIAGFHSSGKICKLNKYAILWNQFYDLLLEIKKSKLYSVDEMGKINKNFNSVYEFLIFKKKKFVEREREGYIKDVHGDLHAENIFLYSNPIVFDRIEFNEKFRKIDVLHEVAFLCMDLESRGRNDLSEEFLKFYLKKSKLEMEEDVFLFYKCYSANVRAKVNLLSYRDSGKKKHLNQYKKYFKLMEKYLKGLIKNENAERFTRH
jgi:aminoglycoside phosphotransferase family enzyme